MPDPKPEPKLGSVLEQLKLMIRGEAKPIRKEPSK